MFKPSLFFSVAYNTGTTAAPAMPITNRAEPILVNLPNPSMASGQMEGHISELARPSRAMNVMAVYPEVK